MKIDKQTIQAWIDNSDLLEELRDKIQDVCDAAHDNGFEAGKTVGEDESLHDFEATEMHEVSDILQEEIGCNFVVEKFKECKTFEEFQYEYQFIYSRSLNFMK